MSTKENNEKKSHELSESELNTVAGGGMGLHRPNRNQEDTDKPLSADPDQPILPDQESGDPDALGKAGDI